MDVRLPKLGEGVDSGSVVTLFVKEGDVVAKGQTLLELENEKAVAPIPSPSEGKVISVRVKAGDKLSVGQVILTLAAAGAAAGDSAPAPKSPEPKVVAESEPAKPAEDESFHPVEIEEPSTTLRSSQKAGYPPPASPSLRRIAKEFGIDLTKVRGSQNGGRIVASDVRSYIQRLQQMAFTKPKPQPNTPNLDPVDFSKYGPVTAKPMSTLRQVISRRMTESWTTIPHVTQFDRADLTRIMELRKQHAAAFEAQGTRLTVTSFVLKAVVSVLKKHPMFNASIDESAQQVVSKQYYHLGLALDTEAGLLVPVIRDVDTKSLLQISKDIEDVAAKGRDRKLSLDDMRGGTFTISNQGGIGSGHFTPIINKPEVAILGLGRAGLEAVVHKTTVVPRLLMPLALSYDHRLIDGANAARFMVDLVAALESFPEKDAKP